MEIAKLFCDVDDFCQEFENKWQQEMLSGSERKRNRESNLCLSEIMTIIIYFHQSSYRNFKDFYTKHVCNYLRKYFPNLVSYNRFVELEKSALLPLCWYLHLRRGHSTGINYIDATSLEICLNPRAKRNKVFKGLANWGKSSVRWYFGFKLHLIINEFGEILSFMITPANVDDRKPVPEMTKNLFGKIFGDNRFSHTNCDYTSLKMNTSQIHYTPF